MKALPIMAPCACVRCGKISPARPLLDHPSFAWCTLPPGWFYFFAQFDLSSTDRDYVTEATSFAAIATNYRGVVACSVECAEAFSSPWEGK